MVDNFVDWFVSIINLLHEDEFAQALVAYLLSKDWLEAKQQTLVSPSSTYKWSLPPKGVLKLNIDGAFSATNLCGGAGFILQNDTGQVVHLGAKKNAASSPFCSEALALREAVDHIVDKDLDPICVEFDCKALVDAVQKKATCPDWHVGILVKELTAVFERCQELSLVYISCSGNMAADWLAKEALKGLFSGGWASFPPTLLFKILHSDVLGSS
ncbi:uncharacterized protein LOC114743397 [Neltuma alba]|uniref:uncharacterized protein LOC114743397 n=1 Tax=Neltuma alba TaxID=207710 RepID=UPI0010A55876|nr:uncharacterized protein LOC114743397 [Prosopis alba]